MILKNWNKDRYEPWMINSVRSAMENLEDWDDDQWEVLLIQQYEMMYGRVQGMRH